MSLMTNWGYTLTDVDALENMVTEEEYNEFTANKYASDSRMAPTLTAASAAVRAYCGWHIYPSLACELSTTFFDKRITEVFGGLLIQLPATFVSEITSVMIGDRAHASYVLEPNGILRLYGVDWNGVYKHTPITIEYVAGVPDDMMGGLKELIAHQTIHALAGTTGVQSETAGGVSVTYNAAWVNSTRATDLSDNNKEVLAPYRLRGVF